MKDRLTVLHDIQTTAPRHLAQAASQWLNEDGMEDIDQRPGELDVDYASGLWRIRAHHVRQSGKELVGAEEFLATLATLNPEKKLVQYSFDGPEHCGSVFFEKANHKYVGVLIVETRTDVPPLDPRLVAQPQTV